jgi:hypothetical protein
VAKTVFAPGSVVTSGWLNAINNPVFVDNPDDDGELPRITNDDLSNAAGQIKQEWQAFRDAFRVAAGAGLNITFQGGAVTLPLGTIATIAPGTLVMANNATSFVFINELGVVVSSTIYPVVGVMLARVITVGGGITTIEDLRPRFRVQPIASAIKVFGGTGEQGDYVLSVGSATFDQGTYYYRNFTIGASTILNVSQFARIYCSGSVVIQGTVSITTFANGGIGFGTGMHSNVGGLSGAGPGAGSGSGGGKAYSYSASPSGSGGGSGFYSGGGSLSTAGGMGSGGAGGGGLWIEAAGGIQIVSGSSIIARGANGSTGSIASGAPDISGGGGGSGGMILLSSLSSVSCTGTLDVRGGNGGNGLNNGGGGGGGGGGLVILISPNNNTTGGTVLLSGGSAGNTPGSGGLGGGAGGGFGGVGGVQSPGQIGQLVLRPFRAVA